MPVSDLGKAKKIKAQDEAKQRERREDMAFLRSELENYNRVNLPMLLLVFAMLSYGLIMLFSASLSSAYAEWGDPMYYVKRQFFFTLIGLILVFVMLRIPIRFFNRPVFTAAVYGAGTILLLLVRLKGVQGDYGAMRWLSLGPIQFQPSELCKIAAIYVLASYFPYVEKAQRQGRWIEDDSRQQLITDGRLYIVYPAVAMGVWLVLILIQPHFSGAFILFLVTASIFWVAKIPGKVWLSGLAQLLPILLILAILLFAIFPLLTKGQSFFDFLSKRFAHVFSRLNTFNNPEEASEDSLHQVVQSRYALGSGGWTGKGLGMGQQKSGFLPMVYNDFILPSIGEELGFLGSVSIIALFVVFFLIGVSICTSCNSKFTVILSWGCTLLITLQALLNIAVAAEVIPPTGISLPFFSYGGSSQIFFLLAVGFILSCSKTGQKADKNLQYILLEQRSYDRSNAAKRPNSSEPRKTPLGY
ncbi:MAG: putative peptidoglycan glycosyltransferase FtsW [Eubacteriales bacterium]|nr:putative peptidoglycan glycosyltransferase FtsW [Eubacteriales bacterium]